MKKQTKFAMNIGNEGDPVFGYMCGDEWIELSTQQTDDATWKRASKDLKASVELLKAITFALEMHRDMVSLDLQDCYHEHDD